MLDDIENGYLYPNPSARFTSLTFNTGKSEEVYVAIYDIQGKMLLSKTESLTPGTHSFRLSVPAPELYHVALLKSEILLSYKALHTEINQRGADISCLGSEALATDENPENHLKSAQNGKLLDYLEGDVVHYTAFSGANTTVISDEPKSSKTIEAHFWLIENSGRTLDSVYIEMNNSIDYIFENLVKDEKKFNELTGYLFRLLEQRSLFGASEYLAQAGVRNALRSFHRLPGYTKNGKNTT